MSSIVAILVILLTVAYWVYSPATPAVPADGSAVEASTQATDTTTPPEASGSQELDVVEILELDPLEVSVEASSSPVSTDTADQEVLATPQEGTSN